MNREILRKYYVSNFKISEAAQKQELAKAVGYTEIEYTKLHEYLAKGHKLAIGYHYQQTNKQTISSENWHGQSFFPIDFDNSPISLSECLECLKPLGNPLFAYETWSNNSFRIVYQVTDEQAEIWELSGYSKQWIITKSFWQELLEYAGELTGLSVGKTAKGKNNYVIDTNIIHKALVLNGTNKTVYADYSAHLQNDIVDILKARAEAKVKKAINAKETAEKRQETLKQAFKGQKWTAEQVESRCKEIGLIANMSAWVGMFNSLIAGVRFGFTNMSEDEAIKLFIDYCDNGNSNNIQQYKTMQRNHKSEKANISNFWGETDEKPLIFDNFQKAFRNAIHLLDGEYVKAESLVNTFEPFKKHLIVAPAGAGKSYSTLHAQRMILKKYPDFERTIFTYPTEPAVKQAYQEAIKVLGADIVASQYDQTELNEFKNKQRKLLFCTYDCLASLEKDKNVSIYDLIIIDEVHLLNDYSSFKRNVTKIIKQFISIERYSIIALTATPQALPLQFFDKITAYSKDTNKRVTIAVSDKRKQSQFNFYLSAAKKQLAKGKKVLIYMNNKARAEQLAKDLQESLGTVGTVGVIHSDNKIANHDFNSIIDNETTHNDVVIATKIINVAVNIKGSIGAIIAFNLYDITELMQLINRERYEADFILLYSPKTRRVPNYALQKKIDFRPLPAEKQQETIEMHKQGDNYKLSSYVTSGLVETSVENVKGTNKLIVSFLFESWNEAYNNYKDLIKLLDPNDIKAYFESLQINANYHTNVKYEDIESVDENDEEEADYTFKSVKSMHSELAQEDFKRIYTDGSELEKAHRYIDTVLRTEQRKLAKQMIEDIALDPTQYDVFKKQKIFLSFGHYK
ncbi:MAG: DEAD/DEAH box helicase, partial [Culicoidibacterales bacterium]